jgi:hypothetical protein
MQRVALAKRCIAEPGSRFLRVASNRGHSASKTRVNALKALQRTAPRRATRCAASGAQAHDDAGEKIFSHSLSPSPKAGLLSLPSCPMRGRFLEAILQRTERKLAGPGRPGTVDGLVAGGALGGAAPSLGRARCLAARGGFTTCLKGAGWCPGASHRSIASRGSRGTGKPRTHCAARMRRCGCLKPWIRDRGAHERATFTAVIARLDRATQYSGPPESHTNGGDYWFRAFAGMTNLYA